ncbi:Asp/Glu racemase [Roseobacter sp. YSTF-M11]|uniref:Asp/Glu racemase n=1 Tax=Roseobacter insulae TaxID=2859783 RepID=A0A9X1K1Y6_9RHOB|nr:Asp/Glu racemase [Roseobacter insulae]MBW4707007.1 Asp/Glu racemase [Roseobacter insulae]
MMNSDARTQARIGVFVPFTNTNLEPDMAMMCPPRVSVHFARLGGYDAHEIPDAHQMAALGAADMEEPIRLLAGVQPDVMIYGCTSATLAHGPEFDRDLATRIWQHGGAYTVTAAGALVHALTHMGATRIAFASPYVSVLNDQAIAFLHCFGIETVSRADVGETLDNVGQGSMTPRQVFDLGKQADSAAADAIVLSCTDMRAVEVISALEADTGKPVITSNQAMLFQALRYLKLPTAHAALGRLFGSDLSAALEDSVANRKECP